MQSLILAAVMLSVGQPDTRIRTDATSSISVQDNDKAPIPDNAAQKKALTMIRGIYQEEWNSARTRDQKLALALR